MAEVVECKAQSSNSRIVILLFLKKSSCSQVVSNILKSSPVAESDLSLNLSYIRLKLNFTSSVVLACFKCSIATC
jgi:hypothetical protein